MLVHHYDKTTASLVPFAVFVPKDLWWVIDGVGPWVEKQLDATGVDMLGSVLEDQLNHLKEHEVAVSGNRVIMESTIVKNR